jgi:hypothetical protein
LLQIPLRKLDRLKPEPAELDRYEIASREDIRALQRARLAWSLRHAYDNVPHYRAKFDAAGVHPDQFKDLPDLAKFPLHAEDRSARQLSLRHVCRAGSKVARIHASSGTTGKPTVVGYTKRDIETWSDVVARSIRAAGSRPGMKVHIAYGYGLFTGGLGAHYGAERLGCTVIPISGGMTERQVQLINDFKPEIIMVTPSCWRSSMNSKAGSRSAQIFVAGRHLRCRTMDQRCARRSRKPSTCTPLIFTGCPKSWVRASPMNAWKPRMACTSGRTISIPRSSTRRPAKCCPMARKANSSSPR